MCLNCRYVQSFLSSELVNQLQDYWIGYKFEQKKLKWADNSGPENIQLINFAKTFSCRLSRHSFLSPLNEYFLSNTCEDVTSYAPVCQLVCLSFAHVPVKNIAQINVLFDEETCLVEVSDTRLQGQGNAGDQSP